MHINNMFWTFQGEGLHAGRRALFVRMPFCNLSCSWCDTTFDTFNKVSGEAFDAVAQSETARFAVVTGGEPTMHKHTPEVVRRLKALGFYVAVESNGTGSEESYQLFDFVTISPKRFTSEKGMAPYHISNGAWNHASEFKYVVDREFDFAVLARHQSGLVRLSLSPEFGEFQQSLGRIIEFVRRNPHWQISLQTHKFMGIP